MVPVELRLKNFLSYGTEAPPLEFDQFHVACLSGGNGQGKSALLDAMTWAVWGEARKSSGHRKPDDDILRIGTQDMAVSFVFDLEGERYRIERTYHQSASGKTSKPGLEFQLYDPASGDWRPLSGGSLRETQEKIENEIGLDYDTFINSSFLLQGRSDEFTKKRPSERKEILAKILNLGRYEALAARARDRWRAAKTRAQQAATEVERLEEALEDVPKWKEERAEVEGEIEAKQAALKALREEEKALTEQLSDLRAKAREAESVEAALERLDERTDGYREDAEELRGKIDRADALLKKSDRIQRAFERYEALQEERDALDEKRERHRAVEKKIEQRRAEMREKKNEAEKRFHEHTVQQKADREALKACTAKLKKKPEVEAALKAAEQAQKHLGAMKETRQRRQMLSEKIQKTESQIQSKGEALRARLDALGEQIEQEKKVLAEADGLPEKIEQLKAQQAQLQRLRKEHEETLEHGQQLREKIEALGGRLDARADGLSKKERTLERLRRAEGGTCPTCGQELTEAHRREVEEKQAQTVTAIKQDLAEARASKEKKEQERDRLRSDYKRLGKKIEKLNGVSEALATARDQRRRRREQEKALREREERAQALRTKIEEENYGEEQRTRRRKLKEKRAEIDFDEPAFEQVQQQAARAEQHRERLDELAAQEERRERLEEKIGERAACIEALEAKLESGAVLGALPGEVETLEGERDAVGFDAERSAEVRRQLKGLSEARSRMKDLVNAQKNRSSWKKQLARAEKRIAEAEEEHATKTETLDALREALEGKPALEEKRTVKAEERRALEKKQSALQGRRGKLGERLAQAEKNRAALEAAREERRDAQQQRTLYKHLKRAFSKHGIPSLIIEQTLPDIEERANRLLDRLTDGRMHVRLETLTDKKSGGTKETLEINISDAQGATRAYETYSGGEGFRVNFALRLALAQLLAERSGVRVRTLVIDEGFGTQDAHGIQNLVEAIQTVRGDFQKILVITHLEELKTKFPVRIEVEKDPALGSTFELSGM